jgi:hypothetical protein
MICSFRQTQDKKDPNRLTEADFQYNPVTATLYYTLRAQSCIPTGASLKR